MVTFYWSSALTCLPVCPLCLCSSQVYKKKTETAKKEYLKQLAAYRATLVSQVSREPDQLLDVVAVK